MENVKETKIEYWNGFYVVLVLSAGKWIVQGEHKTRQAAESDRANWM